MATSIINRLPSSLLSWRSPFEILHKRLSDRSLLRVFECLYYATNTRPHKDKFAPRAIECIFLRLSPGQNAYRLFDMSSHHLFVSRDDVFHETIFPFQSMSSPPASLPLPTPTSDDNVGHENGMPWITIVRNQNTITERIVNSRTWFAIHYA